MGRGIRGLRAFGSATEVRLVSSGLPALLLQPWVMRMFSRCYFVSSSLNGSVAVKTSTANDGVAWRCLTHRA
eukprot:4794542-Pyramimonas_sp.AAC.1